MDFTDAIVVALCERLGIHHVASVDRDFATYRYKGRSKFINVFFAKCFSERGIGLVGDAVAC